MSSEPDIWQTIDTLNDSIDILTDALDALKRRVNLMEYMLLRSPYFFSDKLPPGQRHAAFSEAQEQFDRPPISNHEQEVDLHVDSAP